MEKLFELTFQDQTLNPQVGTFTDASQATGTFTLEDGEYYLTNADTKGFYAYAPIAIQPDSGTDNKVTVEFDLKVVTASANTHTIIGTYAGVDGSGIPTGAKITLQYNAGEIELVLGSGATATLIAAADVVVDQWYHFRIGCALDVPTESTYQVKIDGTAVTTVTGTTADYALGIIGVLGTDLHACDECGIKNIRLITDDDYFVGRTALNQAFTDTKGYVDNQVGACVPRSGGTVLTGQDYSRTVNNSQVSIHGGMGWGFGGTIATFGCDSVSYSGSVVLQASLTSPQYKNMALSPDGTWTWDGQPVQYISDQRLKQQITEIDDKLLDAWQGVDLVQFKYNDAVDAKKDKARLHTGYVVQQIDKACKSHGVDVSAYGLFCHEEYPQEVEEVEVEQEDGTKTKETKVIREASEHYSLRYTEVYAVECMYLRRCIKQLTARIEQLEKEREASK